MNPALKTAFCKMAYHSGLLGIGLRLTESRPAIRESNRFQILVYHRVGKETDPFTSAIGADAFSQHMRVVREHFTPISLTEALNAADERALPPRAIAVTFDDGYRDIFHHALPALRRYGIPATVYLASGLLGDGAGMWNDRIGIAIRDTSRRQISDVRGKGGALPIRNAAERVSALQATLDALKRAPGPEREEAATRVAVSLGVPVERGPAMLQWEQVRRMREHQIEFGAHTVNHPILSTLARPDAEREIRDSKSEVEEQIQEPVRHFAYPNGTLKDFDDSTKALVREVGFASAVSTMFGVNDAATDRYALKRGGPWEEDAATFATKMWWYRRQPTAASED